MARRLKPYTVILTAALAGCSSDPTATQDPSDPSGPVCDLALEFLVDTPVGRDGIPSLQDPELVGAEPSSQNAYLLDGDRVLGFVLDGGPIAIPHNILWYHEIVNLDRGSVPVAITYCPLTGSALAFDRRSIGGQALGISGLLFMNNLIMYNRGQPEALWPQMLGQARCGDGQGRELARFPIYEMTWGGWKDLYPHTKVVSSDVNISRNYAENPYGAYDDLSNEQFLYPNMPDLDRRRAIKERVIGLPSTAAGEPGIAFPFLALEAEPGSWTILETTWGGEDVVLFWSDQWEGGAVFRPRHPETGQRLSFTSDLEGIVDDQSGSRWTITGRAVEGPDAGLRLDPVADAYVAFWGAWAAFHPATRLWEGAQ